MRTLSTAVALTLALAGAAEAQAVKKGALTLDDLQVRATVAGVPTSAAYLTIENHGKAADRLLSIDCACAGSAMMHRTETKAGISSMSMVDAVDVPAGGKVAFSPNGLHVMLVGLKGPLKAGAVQPMTLTFQKAGKVTAPFRVVETIGAK
jgi:copper(I)-binding protein